VETIATGVSANLQLFELAAAEHAQLLLVHHGLFWGSGPGAIDVALKRRLKILFDADIALAAYHLPLDAHPRFGNNALLAQALGAETLEPFALHRGQPIGILARLPGEGLSPEALFARVHEITSREPLVFDTGPAPTHCSRVSRRSARWPARARRTCTSSPRATTPLRPSASGASASTWPSASACATCSSMCPIPSELGHSPRRS
jgi:putative NIF3 family GTP cyclohydrolase 1 type 2